MGIAPKFWLVCPKCGSPDFNGYTVQGVVTRKCSNKDCRNEWSGGLPQEPLDPRIPYPVEQYTAPMTFEQKAPRSDQQKGTLQGVVEVRRPVDTRPEFRKGAPIPEDGEEL